MTTHHAAFAEFTPWEGIVEPGWTYDFLGVRTRDAFRLKPVPATAPRHVRADYPGVDEELFEWLDVLEAVRGAEGSFTMVELGAGYGRWLVRGAAVARASRGLPSNLVGVEAEPSHFEKMKAHFRDNGLDPDAHSLRRAAVAAKDGTVHFLVGHASKWYGQSIAAPGSAAPEQYPQSVAVAVPAVSLSTVLEPLDRVDLVDLDVQGAELDVLHAAKRALCEKVKRVHVGTHGDAQEAGLRLLFRRLGWRPVNDYRHSATQATPYGAVRFGDGVQTWVNDNPRRPRRKFWWPFG